MNPSLFECSMFELDGTKKNSMCVINRIMNRYSVQYIFNYKKNEGNISCI